jgi:15-cis-phytoene synthase
MNTPTAVTLEQSYAECRRLNREYGTTYYWATFALPRIKRHHVHALYGFCRYADEIVDDPNYGTTEERARALADFGQRLFSDLALGRSDDLVLRAVVHTIRAFDLDTDLFVRFMRSMTMDLTVSTYDTYDDLMTYVDGSAAVIGEMMLPILEAPDEAARSGARALGVAFQLTNFLRDVGEDLDRGRVYLPQEDLRRFGADPHRRVVDDAWVELMRFEINRCRDLYAEADAGIARLPASSAKGIWAARKLYAGILDQIEGNGFNVFDRRATVSTWRKLAVVAGAAAGRIQAPATKPSA